MTKNITESLFRRNEVLRHKDESLHRVLKCIYPPVPGLADEDIEWEKGYAWLIELNQPQALPYRVSHKTLKKLFRKLPEASNTVRDSMSEPLSARTATEAQLAVAQAAWARIEPLVSNPAELANFDDELIFFPVHRSQLLKERSESGSGTPKTLLKDLRRYWQGGQTMDALLGHYDNSGRRAKGTNKRGRPSGFHRKTYQLTAEDEQNMRRVLVQHYLTASKNVPLTKTLTKLHEEYYTYLDGNGVLQLLPSSECPSRRQLEYYLKKHFPLQERLKLRKGEKRFAQGHRAKDGSIQRECHGAGHIYEFDATIVDVILVSSKNRAVIVGKPTLYLIIDRETRLIVGFYIGFENACYSAAMQAILSIAEDKQALCNRLDLPYSPDDWVADGILPEMFLADQGELMHLKARRIARSIRSTLSNVPGMRPDWKPLVECGFKMLHQIIAVDTPGYVPDAETRKRRSINKDKEASLTLHAFTQVIVRAIILHNKSAQPGYPLTVAQVNDGVKPIPRELWNHSIRKRIGLLDKADYNKLRQELLARDTATTTEEGIVFKSIVYSCPEAKQAGWFVEGRRRRMPLEVAFDYRLVDRILVFSPDGSGMSLVASLSKDSVMFNGMSFFEVAQHFNKTKALTGQAIEETRDAQFEYRQSTKTIIDDAAEQTKAVTKGKSRSSRKADTKDARAIERNAERGRTSQVGLDAGEVPTSAAPASNVTPLRPRKAAPAPAPAPQSPAPSPQESPAPKAGLVELSTDVQDLIAAKRRLLLS